MIKKLLLFLSVIIFLTAVFIDLSSPVFSDIIFLIFIPTIFFLTLYYGVEARILSLLGILFLGLCPWGLIFGQGIFAEKIATWAWIFWLLAIVFCVCFRKRKEKITLEDICVKVDKWRRKIILGFKTEKAQYSKTLLNETKTTAAQVITGLRKEFKEIESRMGFERRIVLVFRFLIKITFYLTPFLVSSAVIFGVFREVSFYHWFFEQHFLAELWLRLTRGILLFWSITIIVGAAVFWQWQSKIPRRLLVIFFLLFVLWGDGALFMKARKTFTQFPYILRISPTIASIWMEVAIYGRNFKNLPEVGKVLINDKEQRIKFWSSEQIVIEIDPGHSQTGELKIANDYRENGWRESNTIKFILYDSRTATLEEEKLFWESLQREIRLEK